jgi:hypothetical protein
MARLTTLSDIDTDEDLLALLPEPLRSRFLAKYHPADEDEETGV